MNPTKNGGPGLNGFGITDITLSRSRKYYKTAVLNQLPSLRYPQIDSHIPCNDMITVYNPLR